MLIIVSHSRLRSAGRNVIKPQLVVVHNLPGSLPESYGRDLLYLDLEVPASGDARGSQSAPLGSISSFVDLWGSFVGRADMHMKDGLHLRGKGAVVLADVLTAAVDSGVGGIKNISGSKHCLN